MNRSFPIVFVALASLHTIGCKQSTTSTSSTSATASSSATDETSDQLRAFGQAFQAYHMSNKRGPENWDEAMAMGGAASLKEKGCLVAWGIRYKDATIGADQFVLAYPPSTMESGGPVLMLDGNVLQAKPEPLKKLLEAQAEIGVPR